MIKRLSLLSVGLLVALPACGTILGVDDFAVDPNFEEEEADDDEADDDEADDDTDDDDTPGFQPNDDDDEADDDAVDDDEADDDEADDDAVDDDEADDDVTDDDEADDDVTDDDNADDDNADDDVADDDVTDDDSDDDVLVEAGVDDDVTDDDSDDDAPADDDVSPVCTPPVSGTCDPVPQCGCGEDNCEFDLDNSGATSCVPAGTRVPYGECSATTNQCPAGYSCVGDVCREFCSGDTALCDQGDYAYCLPVSADETSDIPGFFTCTRTCDPRDPTSEADGFLGCGPGVACIPHEGGVSNCYSASAARTEGQSCAGVGGVADPLLCAPGLGCALDLSGTPVCQRYCDVNTEECGAGAECQAYSPSLFAGPLEMGTCLTCDNVPPGGECSYWPQCGCGDGEMCYLDFETYTSGCFPAAEGGLNDFCSPTEPCGPGLDCLWVTSTQEGVCTQFCQDVTDCPSPNSICINLGIEGVNHCLWGCDPRDPSNSTEPFAACAADQTCVPVTDGDSVCSPTEGAGAPLGGYCSYDVECDAGLGCDGYYGTCAQWCAVGGSDCLSPSSSCFERSYTTSAGVEFGLCREAVATLTSLDPATPILDLTTIQSTITVPEATYYPSRLTVEVNLSHTFVGDLRLELRAPDGTLVVLLASGSLSAGDNLSGTRFDDVGMPIYEAVGTAPYLGAYQPETPLQVLTGKDAAGIWTLSVTDTANGDTGTFNGWSLHFW